MTSEGLGEMIEGDTADTCGRKFQLVSMGPSGGSSMHRPGSDDPHGCQQIFHLEHLSTSRSLSMGADQLYYVE